MDLKKLILDYHKEVYWVQFYTYCTCDSPTLENNSIAAIADDADILTVVKLAKKLQKNYKRQSTKSMTGQRDGRSNLMKLSQQ